MKKILARPFVKVEIKNIKCECCLENKSASCKHGDNKEDVRVYNKCCCCFPRREVETKDKNVGGCCDEKGS